MTRRLRRRQAAARAIRLHAKKWRGIEFTPPAGGKDAGVIQDPARRRPATHNDSGASNPEGSARLN
jgi:hypothetical protein